MPDNPPRPGDVLDGRYRLVERLGHGGFGDVWRAEELLPDGAPFRDVALKLLHAGGADAIDWAEEAKLLASFRHPSLVTIYAAGIITATPSTPPRRFVAMELLEGQNLAELLRVRQKVSWRRVVSWALSAAAALDLIHAAGVVHLDLKPANLFLAEGGTLKVLDFGIARRAGVSAMIPRRGERSPATMTTREAEMATGLFIAGRVEDSHADEAFAATRPVASVDSPRVVIGTPGFMAPEVLELCEPTAAADAYALAVCVVQLVTGHLPQEAPDEPASWDDPTAVSQWLDEIRTATLRGLLRPIDASAMGLPRGVAALIRRLLSVDPALRGVTPGKLGALFEEAWERPHGVPDPPYFGLAPYRAEGEGLLFGRDDDIARLGRELSFEPAVVLQGPAGAGKSSLAAAGIVPYLARCGADGKDDWIAAEIAPGSDPDAALDEALGRISNELPCATIDNLAAWCERSPVGIVLLVDPLDALVHAPVDRRARLEAICEAIGSAPARPGLRLLAAIREDAVPAMLHLPAGASLRAALRFVGLPATAAVKDIVAGPAHFAGVPVIDVDKIAADVQRELRAGGVRLPYVGLSLLDFWTARAREAAKPLGKSGAGKSAPPPASLDGAKWKATAGVRGALVRHAERVTAALDGEDHAIAQEILLRLSTTDGRPVRWEVDELCETVSTAHARRVIEHLAREHIVLWAGGSVEIGHEALLTDWTRLASARLSQMDRLALLERLREARLAWERADGHRDFLLHGGILDEMKIRAAWIERGLGPADHAFIAESRRRARTAKAGRWATGVFVAALLAGGAYARHAAEEAQEAEARTKAAAIELEQLAELAARARRTDDPYQRVAFAAAALERGSPDGLLPLEIASAAGNAARAVFLSLDPIDGPTFPWDDRFLFGVASGHTLAIVDFRPPEPDVIEDIDLDFDPDKDDSVHFKKPVIRRLRPHEAPVVERVPFGFDTAFATRAADGEVKVFRLRDDGLPALAAIAPMRCAGSMATAAAAPVLACATDGGVARWDLRRHKEGAAAVAVHAFPGKVADVSADGERVAAFSGRDVLLWMPGEGTVTTFAAARPVAQVRLSPRDRVAAVLSRKVVEILDERRAGPPIFSLAVREGDQIRWDDGGLDVSVCGAGVGRWYYLRRGGRAKDDPAPRGEPCLAPRPKNQPEPVRGADDYRDLADRELGPHLLLGGFRLRRHRYLSRDLVLFDGSAFTPDDVPGRPPASVPPAAARLLRFDGRDEIGGEEPRGDQDAIVAMERDETFAMFQIGEEVRFYGLADGTRLFGRKGNFLRRCGDGRYLTWSVEGDRHVLADAWTGARLGDLPREPGIVVGADGACSTLYTQRLDGTLVARPIAGGPAREIGVADGYVYLARPIPPRNGGAGGLLLAFGSGAVARIDDAASAVQVLAYATPRATAIADGPKAGDVVYADATGVVLARAGAPPAWLRDGAGGVEWEDLSAAPDGGSILLAADDRLAVLDVTRRELTGSMPVEGRGRLSRWDDEGSVIAWSFARKGGPEGMIIPRGVTLARSVSTAISNLVVEKGRITIRR